MVHKSVQKARSQPVAAGWPEQPGDDSAVHQLVALASENAHQVIGTRDPAAGANDRVSFSLEGSEAVLRLESAGAPTRPLGLDLIKSRLEALGSRVSQPSSVPHSASPKNTAAVAAGGVQSGHASNHPSLRRARRSSGCGAAGRRRCRAPCGGTPRGGDVACRKGNWLSRSHRRHHSRQRVDRLLDVDRDGGHLQVVAVLLVLALPNELRVERGVAWVSHCRGPLLFGAGEQLKLGGGDVGATVRQARVRADLGFRSWRSVCQPSPTACLFEGCRAATAKARK